MIYLAIPYSHPDPEIRKKRSEIGNRVAAQVVTNGFVVYSSISHSHSIGLQVESEFDFNLYRKKLCDQVICICTTLMVIAVDGWEKSEEVIHVLKLATRQKKEIVFVTEYGKKIEIFQGSTVRDPEGDVGICSVCGYRLRQIKGVCLECLLK